VEAGHVRVRRFVGVGEREGELGEVLGATAAHRGEDLAVKISEVVGSGCVLGGHGGWAASLVYGKMRG
jgi:hypothetical protein